MATEKKKTGSKTVASKTRKKPTNTANLKKQAKKQDARMNAILIAAGFIVVGLFLFVAVQLKAAGQFGNLIGDFFKGTMGVVGILFPIYLMVFGLIMLVTKTEKFSKLGFFLGLLLLFMLCVLNSGRFVTAEDVVFNAKKLYESGVALEGGGLFGMLMAGLIVKYLGKIGLYVISLGVIAVIGFILFRNTPIRTWINAIRIRIQEARIKHDEKLDEKERLREIQENQRIRIQQNKDKLDEIKNERKRRKEDGQGTQINAFDGLSLFPEGHTAIDDTSELDHTYSAFAKRGATISYMGEEAVSTSDPVDSGIHYNPGEYGLEPKRVQQHGKGMDDTVEMSDEDRERLEAALRAKEKPSRPISMPKQEPEESKTITEAPKPKRTSTDISKEKPASEDPKDVPSAPTRMPKREPENATLVASDFTKQKKNPKYKKPPIELLNVVQNNLDTKAIGSELQNKADLLERTLNSFNVGAKVVHVTHGPAVTRYEVQPDVGVKVSKIKNLQDDIALNLGAKSIRIEAPVPGKSVVGIEIENESVNMVSIREIIESKEFKQASSKITFCVGRDISGATIVADLKEMPHLLIAGSTGSGKSVCINGILTSILYKADPDEVKLILIDPKVVELGDYNGIPHLLIPVVTDPAKAVAALNWAVAEMTERYKKFADVQVRNLAGYNEYVEEELKKRKGIKGEYDSRSDGIKLEKLEKMPQIVIVIDELAELMMTASSQVEDSIYRITQLARAAGMHLIVATQRPSTDVITGVIKSNIPSRIAFAVPSQYDSRTILDIGGAEKLVGKGDMLYNPVVMNHPVRIQGCFIGDDEIHRVINYVKNQANAEYSSEVMDTINSGSVSGGSSGTVDELYDEAVRFVIEVGKASTSLIQRRFRIGYNRAANIIDEMELQGIIGPADGSKPRQILVSSVPSGNMSPSYTPEPAMEPEPDIAPEPMVEETFDEVDEEEGIEPEVVTAPKTSADIDDLQEYVEKVNEPIKSSYNAETYSSQPIEEEDVNQDISDLWDALDDM